MTGDTPEDKKCAGPCGETKLLTEFYLDRSRKDGHARLCKKCSKEKSSQYYQANKEALYAKNRIAQARYRENHPEVAREASRRYRTEHPEAVSEAQHKYYETHREERNEASRLYDSINKEKLRVKRIQRHSKLRNEVFKNYGELCACCGTTEDLAIDHIGIPGTLHRREIGTGGGVSGFYQWLRDNDFPDGYQTLCRRCNTSKGRGNKCIFTH